MAASIKAQDSCEPSAPLSAYVLGLPKAELHLHLEGAILPETVVELAHNHGRELALEDVHRLYEYTDFTGFLQCFRDVTRDLATPEDYELITYRLLQQLAAQNVMHAEVYVSVGACLWWGRDFDQLFAGMERGRERGEREFGVSLYWIFDAVRHLGPERAMQVAERAAELRSTGSVIGFGLGGDERRAGPELFGKVYEYAARQGLRLLCHAGETVGPDSIWTALKMLKTERIGHGLTAWQDRALLSYLADSQVPLEICVTSNLRTGCIHHLKQHPLKTFFDLGLLVTLNSDDPAMFGTTLAREYQIAQDIFGFNKEQLKRLAMNSFQASFLPGEKKKEYLKLFAEL
jgi:adenosine deaminase/aminodeoxyfutalosine deaminase